MRVPGLDTILRGLRLIGEVLQPQLNDGVAPASESTGTNLGKTGVYAFPDQFYNLQLSMVEDFRSFLGLSPSVIPEESWSMPAIKRKAAASH